MAKKTVTEEPEVEETVESAPAEEAAPAPEAYEAPPPPSPPPVEVYEPVAQFLQRESAPPSVQIKLTRANHMYYRRLRGLMRSLGHRV
jgi:hypothetical protein